MMIEYSDWGLIEYATAWDKQKELFEERISAKAFDKKSVNELPNIAVFCEHPHVYTLGKSGVLENLLVSNQTLIEHGVSFFRTDRGGDITYHGPGQIVAYPIFDLEQFNIGLRQYIYNLEEAVIRFLAGFGLKGERLEGATGVWIDPKIQGKARKICAIGVKSSRFVTMHGLALNINTDLSYYNYINPCGFIDKGVTSLQKETGIEQSMPVCREKLYENLNEVFLVKK
jgi:lipoyl(octanoyl) transferase